ncbi:geranylgeranyl pyrophosphate synthase IdsA [Kitasatospora paracochleata]|uniref:Geranylgeranyl diphosphate synthase type I n=1 Tax=Kitasatospora paracochleata TaxID=58354 RepID=A0ABT1IWQ1_9ACTN|nr:polyprenyl synthetase family protein [Kitasatospora paracochleata]MCP2309576.1 geranylgeranyl diphosphate synthase type I [Kitasatospora paracochleata]
MAVLDDMRRPAPALDVVPPPAAPDLAAVRREVDAALATFLDAKEQSAPGPELPSLIAQLRTFLAGGKRLRPLLCVCGWYAGGGAGDHAPAVRAAAGLELFQAFALIHDDVMDASDTRRGQPSAHRALAAAYTANGGPADRAEEHGLGAAVLLGDLALIWSDELLHGASLTVRSPEQVLPLLDEMRSEVLYGQYLDLQTTGRLSDDVDTAVQVIRYKTAKYTVERPLHIGAALAGATAGVDASLSAFALPLGEAFQLRDDLLGVFGDPLETGKSVLDDVRAGKATVLMALAAQRASRRELRSLRARFGRRGLTERDAAVVRSILESTGARQAVEEMIRTRRDQALTALDNAPFPAGARAALRDIAGSATARQA